MKSGKSDTRPADVSQFGMASGDGASTLAAPIPEDSEAFILDVNQTFYVITHLSMHIMFRVSKIVACLHKLNQGPHFGGRVSNQNSLARD